jgi:hypothetical protein
MKELYVEVLAKHNGHESCADNREVVREALDSGMYRLGIEPRKIINQSVDVVLANGRQNQKHRYARCYELCVVEDPTHVQKLYARESGDPTVDHDHLWIEVRIENPIGVQQ